MHTLKTKALTSGGYEYPVTLRPDELGWVLRIESTGGSWYLDSLSNVKDILAIDYGQGWYCLNARDLINEANNYINTLKEAA